MPGAPRGALSRRGFLRGGAAAGLAVGAPGLLAACGMPSARLAPGSCESTDRSSSQKELSFSNWTLYIDEAKVKVDGKKKTVFPTLDAFEKQTGINVDYVADINDNNEFFGIVRNQLAGCQPINRDIIVFTDWMAARTINLNWVQKLDKAALPNVRENLIETLRSPVWDPDRDYSVPWQTGLTGIAYNSKLTGEVRSFEELTTRADLKGRVTLLQEMPDTMKFMLLLEGADPEKFTDTDFENGIDRLQKIVDSGQIRNFTGNDYAQDLVKGNVLAAEAWSGDVLQLQFDNPEIKFVAPEEGLAIWSDNMLVPNKAEHKANAEELMNYYYDPKVAAELAAWVNYICPVEGAQDEMVKIDPSLAENELIFPTDELLSKASGWPALDPKTEQKYQRLFAEVTGA